MKVLLVNKFLYPKGGSETYIFKLGEYLECKGHKVQYFGMTHEGNIVGNGVDSYTSNMDFHKGSRISKLTYPIKTIYSHEARKKMRLVLDDFQPDVCHINNFNFQLTPSIILEIVKWRKKAKKNCKIIFTAHDSQLVCPNHLMQNPQTGESCTKCLGGHFGNCIKGKCIHNSFAKSIIGAVEGWFWNAQGVYKNIDVIISPSRFLSEKLATNLDLNNKITVMHNFIDICTKSESPKDDYVLFYGRYSGEKGIGTLLQVIDDLKNISFVFAGDGPLKEEVAKRSNITDKGFLSGDELKEVISKARFAVIPSECYENCPFSVMESQMCGTPVIGADIGGIPELIRDGETGELFESGNATQLKEKILSLWGNKDKLSIYTENCNKVSFTYIGEYYEKLIDLYL